MNPKQFEERIPYQTPIIAVNLPKRRWSHPFTNNDKRPLQLNYGAIEGPRRLRVGHQRSLPDDDSFNMEVDFLTARLDDPLLADVVIKERKYFSPLLALRRVDAAKQELGANAAVKEPFWPDLFAESKLCKKLKQECIDSMTSYLLQRIHKESSKKDFEKKLYTTNYDLYTYRELHGPIITKWLTKYGYALLDKLQVEEVHFWISGVDDPLLADVVTNERKYFSSLIAELIVNATKRKFGANAADKEPLWADLVVESMLCEKLQQEYKDSKLLFMGRRLLIETSEEDFEKMWHTITIDLNTKGHQYSAVVTKWLKKYGLQVRVLLNSICMKS